MKYGDFIEFGCDGEPFPRWTELLMEQENCVVDALLKDGKLKKGDKIKLGWYMEVKS